MPTHNTKMKDIDLQLLTDHLKPVSGIDPYKGKSMLFFPIADSLKIGGELANKTKALLKSFKEVQTPEETRHIMEEKVLFLYPEDRLTMKEITEFVKSVVDNARIKECIIITRSPFILSDAIAGRTFFVVKEEGELKARATSGGLYGTSPDEINCLYGEEKESLSSRHLFSLLEELDLNDPKARKEAEDFLKVMGSSFHRAELRAMLKNTSQEKEI